MSANKSHSHSRIILSGMLALATAMGIGRFAFTPLLPMMLHDGTIDLAQASWLASANYIGYLVGALLCSIWRLTNATFAIRVGLVGTLTLTLAMVSPFSAGWAFLRFAAGVASAIVFVYTSGWCLTQSALRGHQSAGALIYIGPGAGIVLSGLVASAMVAADWRASSGWLIFGVMATFLTAMIWPVFHPKNTLTSPTSLHTDQDNHANDHSANEVALLAFAYGMAGFGYIITATFLPVIARQFIAGTFWLDLFWPIFGIGVILGALIASRMRRLKDLRAMLIACYLLQALGVLIGVWFPTVLGFGLGSLLIGLPFTAITYFAMQEARRIRPHHTAQTIGLLTALYGLGQILGPPLAIYLVKHANSTLEGFNLALEVAVASLLVGGVLFFALTKKYPLTR